jgi:hypothetical protein
MEIEEIACVVRLEKKTGFYMIATKSGEIRIISTTDIDKIMYSKEEISTDA